MARIKYYYDTESCRYERIKVSTSDIILNFLGFLALIIVFGFGIYLIIDANVDSPKMVALQKENEELLFQYKLISKEVESMSSVVSSLEEKDDNVYRTILGAEPISDAIRNGGIGGVDRYNSLIESGLTQEELIISNYKRIDELKKKVYIQSKSYEDLMNLAKKKEERFASLPAIQPVSNKKLKRLASGFGYRTDPVHGTRRMHYGVDFSAPIGTAIYATANGTVSKASYSRGGFGYYVKIDHGFGYETLYGHMNEYVVKQGQKVVRGELIGYVGNTGKSTGPHLHYEVHKNKEKINPVYFFNKDLSPEEFEEVLRLASIENQALGSY